MLAGVLPVKLPLTGASFDGAKLQYYPEGETGRIQLQLAHQWTDDFVNEDPGWVDIVEDFVPIP